MLSLIDADIVLHRVGFTTENDPADIARIRCDEMLDGILLDTNCDQYQLWLSDSKENNFRYQIDPNYKANRIAPKPKHYEFLKEYVLLNWGARIAYGMEADDALGIGQDKEIHQLKENEFAFTTVICSIDKDLKMIPGLHYNFVKKEFDEVSYQDGQLAFYRSILTGDVADNIKGIYGIGPKKAEKILPKWESEEDAIKKVVAAYLDWIKKDKGNPQEAIRLVRMNGQLLKIKQEEDEPIWSHPYLNQMEEQMSEFILPQVVALNPSTGPISQATSPLAG